MPQQYTVLARKWRPQQFDEMVGQEHVTQTLQNAIRKNRIAHAYLFVGPRGIGKTSTARIFAKALNCVRGPTPAPCDKCDNCREIAEGRSFDVLEFDAASNTQVDKIREIILDTVKYAPAKSRYKIYLVDEVHMLSDSSFNALLKTLEEPPSHVIFFFATTDPQKVPPTILSRCQRFDLRRIPAAAIFKHLQRIAKAEKVNVEDEALLAITRGVEGSLRDAESALDQLISFCGNKITEEDVLGVFGLVSQTMVSQLADAVIDGKSHETLRIVRQIVEAGKDLQRLHADLLTHFRNLLVLTVSADAGESLDVSDVELQTLREQAKKLDTDTALRIMDTLAAAENRLRYALSKQIILEVTLLQAIRAKDAVKVELLLKKLNELKAALGGGGEQAEATPTPAVSAHASATAVHVTEQRPAKHRNPTSLLQIWEELLDYASKASPFLRDYLVGARPLGLQNGVLTVAFSPEYEAHKAFVDTAKNIQILQGRLKQVLNEEITLRLVVEAEEAVATPSLEERKSSAASVAEQKADAKSEVDGAVKPAHAGGATVTRERIEELQKDPLIKKALEIFRGSIVDARG